MNSDTEYAHGDGSERALVAAFTDRESANEAAKRLHTEGFHKTWIGVTTGDSLTETLARHGVSEAEARRIEASIEPNDVILTVDGHNHPELAAEILEDFGGNILAGESFIFATINWAGSGDAPGSQLLGYEDPNFYARGQRVENDGYSRLRNERLGSNTVPILREDVFIMSFDDDDSGTRSAGGAIGTQHRDEVEL